MKLRYLLAPWIAFAGDLATTLAQGISWTFDRLPQNEALVRWIRSYNADPSHRRKINFYGFDVPGSPGNPAANRGLRTALDETLRSLDRVDSTSVQRRFPRDSLRAGRPTPWREPISARDSAIDW